MEQSSDQLALEFCAILKLKLKCEKNEKLFVIFFVFEKNFINFFSTNLSDLFFILLVAGVVEYKPPRALLNLSA